jgi:hypothetical protein
LREIAHPKNHAKHDGCKDVGNRAIEEHPLLQCQENLSLIDQVFSLPAGRVHSKASVVDTAGAGTVNRVR